jgi:hypothetical protein
MRYRSRSGERRIEWSASEGRLESGQQRLALLAQRCELASQAWKRCGPCIAAEAPRDRLLDLEPAQVALCLVVVEGDGEIIQEGEYLLLAEGEPFE